MVRKVVGILVIFSFLVMNAAITYIPAYTKGSIEKSIVDANSEKSEDDSEKEELRLVELEEFLISSQFLLYSSDRSSVSLFHSNARMILSPYFCLPYPPPNA